MGWVSSPHFIVWNAFCNNSACTNHSAIPYMDSWQNGYARTNPDIIPDDNRFRFLKALQTHRQIKTIRPVI